MRAYQRLLRYAAIPTASDAASGTCPSTARQLAFARTLKEELEQLGLSEVTLDDNGYLFATLPANIPNWQGAVIGFIAHMDVTPDAPSEQVKPHIVENYDGGDIVLNEAEQIVMRAADFPVLQRYIGDDLVVTDGTTLLGADDKAGIAEIVTMAETLLLDDSIKHGRIMLGFTPDEEIGRGADRFDVARFGADFAYTVDGAAVDHVNYETFHAVAADVLCYGKGIHPGEAKNKMVNAQHLAMEFAAALPAAERPEHTEGYEGFFHLHSMRGDVEQAELHYILRDHDYAALERRMKLMEEAARFLNGKYGVGAVQVTLRETYRNMAEMVLPHRHLLDTAYDAVRAEGGQPASKPVRGGTDGSRLSYMGLPCPNLGTGSHNHHGRMEFASVQAMDRMTAVLVRIAAAYADISAR